MKAVPWTVCSSEARLCYYLGIYDDNWERVRFLYAGCPMCSTQTHRYEDRTQLFAQDWFKCHFHSEPHRIFIYSFYIIRQHVLLALFKILICMSVCNSMNFLFLLSLIHNAADYGYLRTESRGEFLNPKAMRMGNGECIIVSNFIFCTYHLIYLKCFNAKDQHEQVARMKEVGLLLKF